MAVLDLSPFNTILQRLEAVTNRLERGSLAVGAGSAGSAASVPADAAPTTEDPAIVQALDSFLKEKLRPVEVAATEAGAEIVEATAMGVKALALTRDLLSGSAKCKKPKD